ncbi:hypothetical protein GCM10023213_23150 [Prosthecobacter algae]|uniref:Uncharacterized protein n=1 Tax=Prosthecobacter algae TaxID=1144682 RepID=A0ABP9P5Z4_9BACT
MATLRKRGKAGAWYALYRDAEGWLRQKATRTLDRKQAQKMADEWERVSRPTAKLWFDKLAGQDLLSARGLKCGESRATLLAKVAYTHKIIPTLVNFLYR